jgi:hypothetical protein
MSIPESLRAAARKKRRSGCLGCLFQIALTLLVGLVLGCAFLLAVTAIFAPWAFYLGGPFHITPYWQGVGKAHAKSGDYVLFVYFGPTPRGSKMYLETNLTGNAYVCTPRGESIRLNLGGGMRKHLNRSTDGEAVHLYMFYWPWNANFINDTRPELELSGHWRNPNLVMDDHSSIARAFHPDGTVYRGHDKNRPYMTEVVPVTLASGSYSDYEKACEAAHR